MASVVLCLTGISAKADCVPDNNGRCLPVYGAAAVQYKSASNGSVIGGRPRGCPHRYCGCGASLYLFGRIKPELNLAANWIRYFPRTQAAPRMAAARRGHVMVLVSHVAGKDWLVHDSNSGGGKTRLHVRSIAGYTVVDPSGSRLVSR